MRGNLYVLLNNAVFCSLDAYCVQGTLSDPVNAETMGSSVLSKCSSRPLNLVVTNQGRSA